MSDQHSEPVSNRRLTRNVLWNLVGTGAPLLVGIVAIPILLEGLGTERFGVLTLAWLIVGYFSLFDLGLGRALTQIIAQRIGRREFGDIPILFWAALSMMTALGVVGAAFAAGLSAWLVHDVLKVPAELQAETLTSFYMLAASIPVVIGTTGLRGTLEAYQRFDLVNAVRIPLGMLTFLAPVAVLPFSKSLPAVIGVLVCARAASWIAYAGMCISVEPEIRNVPRVRTMYFRPLLRVGGWMTVSNIIGPLMAHMDRFLIAAVVSLSAVAYYATPFEVVTKLWVIPVALMGVVFPAFSSALATDPMRAARLFERVVEYVFLSLFPIALLVVTFAHEGLAIWIGAEFAQNSAVVLQLLTIGVFINSHARVPFGLIQGAGRPDLTAKLHLLELPIYIALLWWLLNDYGIIGAAVAWVLRIILDTVLLFGLAERKVLPQHSSNLRWLLIIVVAMLVITAGGMMAGAVTKGLYSILALVLFAGFGWSIILNMNERRMIRGYLAKMSTPFS
jgi:O-antigen/teichoic acid export membrane protein